MRQRRLIAHVVATGAANVTASGRYAGYSAGRDAHDALATPRMQAELRKEALAHYGEHLPAYAERLRAIALDPAHPDCARALIFVFGVAGIVPAAHAEHTETTVVGFDRTEALAELARLEEQLNLPRGRLLLQERQDSGGGLGGAAEETEDAARGCGSGG